MDAQKPRRERGQTLVIVVMSMFVFLAFLALALDGGYSWAQRRKAQTAADAGALAGTRQLCITANASIAIAAAQDYAVVRNQATSADVTVDMPGASVEVTSHVVFNTFFAQLLGRPVIDAQATAKATCLLPGTAEGVLPVAWSCRPPIPGGSSTSEDCEQEGITAEEFEDRAPWDVFHDELYLIMDSADFEDDLFCVEEDPAGTMICDLNGDGEIDVLGGGNRSWLDLDGNGDGSPGGASELNDWIENGYAPEISTHTWVPDNPGTKASTFIAAATRIGDIVILPVFDMFCQGLTTGADCATLVHTEDDPVADTIVPANGNSIYVHIISFSGFGISCVKAGGNVTCPAFERFKLLNPHINGINSFKTIEGYFITGFVPGLGGGEPGIPDAGVYVLLLTE